MVLRTDNRKNQRLNVRIPAIVIRKSQPNVRLDAEVRNISEGGALVNCATILSIGEEVSIEILFQKMGQIDGTILEPDKLNFEGSADPKTKSGVVWRDEKNFGLVFRGLSEEKKRNIDRLIKYYGQLTKAGVSF